MDVLLDPPAARRDAGSRERATGAEPEVEVRITLFRDRLPTGNGVTLRYAGDNLIFAKVVFTDAQPDTQPFTSILITHRELVIARVDAVLAHGAASRLLQPLLAAICVERVEARQRDQLIAARVLLETY